MSQVLDLEVLPGHIDEISRSIILSQIPGPIDLLLPCLVQGILHKHGFRLFPLPVIPGSNAGTTDADLSDFSLFRDFLILLVQQEYLFVREGLSRRDYLIQSISLCGIQHEIRAVAGDLGRTVEIDICRIRQVLFPDVQLLHRHHLSAEEDLIHLLRNPVGEAVHDGHKAHGTHRPDERGNLVVSKVVHQCGWIHKVVSRDQDYLCPRVQAAVDVLDGDIEIKRCLVSHHIIPCDAEGLVKDRDKVDHGAMADHHSLGDTGTAGGEVHVQGICVEAGAADLGQHGRICLWVLFFQLFQIDYQVLRRKELSCRLQVPVICKDHRRIQLGDHGLHSGLWLPKIEKGIEPSRINRAHHADHRGNALFHEKCHGPIGHADAGKGGTNALCLFPECAPGDAALRILKGDFVWICCCRMFQPIKNGIHIYPPL